MGCEPLHLSISSSWGIAGKHLPCLAVSSHTPSNAVLRGCQDFQVLFYSILHDSVCAGGIRDAFWPGMIIGIIRFSVLCRLQRIFESFRGLMMILNELTIDYKTILNSAKYAL